MQFLLNFYTFSFSNFYIFNISFEDELREIISQVVGKMSIANAECKLDELKSTLTKEGHVEEKGGQMSYVANDFMEKLKTRGISRQSFLSPFLLWRISAPNECVATMPLCD